MDFDNQDSPKSTDTTYVIGTKNRRKPAKVIRDMVAPKATVIPLSIDDMVVKVYGGACHFKRLKYKGCPTIWSRTGEFRSDSVLVDMNRDGFIRELFGVIGTNLLKRSFFYCVIDYVKWLDSEEKSIPRGDYWDEDLVDGYMQYVLARVQQNLCSKSSLSAIRATMSWVLKKLERKQQANNLPSIKGVREAVRSYQGLHPETELKPIARLLFGAYKESLKHFERGTELKRHPLWDEELAEKEATRRDLKGTALYQHRAAPFKVLFHGGYKKKPYKTITELAMMITFMFTGMNLAPLSRMKICDVRFKTVQGGKFLFDAQKDRAKYLQLDNAIGFSKYAREFIEGWMSVSLIMAGGDHSAPLFPFYKQDGNVISYHEAAQSPQKTVNLLLPRLGLPVISSSVLRQTKASILMQVTESLYLVSLSLNNSVEVVRARYAHGHEADHRKNLSASMGAQMDIILGKPVNEAVEENKFKVADILDEYDYQRLRADQNRVHESRTPLGVRCSDNTKGAAGLIRRAIDKAGVEISTEEALCTDFLGCFECEQHALVADVEGIWLMLSFKDTMAQMQQIPAVNSMPKNQYSKLWNTLVHILSLYQDKAPGCFRIALDKHKSAPHPLFATVQSLTDLLEIF